MEATRLDNDVRVISEAASDLRSVTVGIWVENGSRYETAAHAGISHFIEHVLFKGTARRTAVQIAEEIDAVGGVLNAFTGKEYTCYYAKVLREHLSLALDVLADLFTASRFPADEIERERAVVLQEIAQLEDTPDDYVHELFSQSFWPGHALARPIVGTPDTVSRLQRDDLLAFVGERYRANRVLIAAAGSLVHEELVEAASRYFGGLGGTVAAGNGGPPAPATGVWVQEKPLEQVHLCLGTPGLAQGDDDRYAANLISVALGGGMSSRLFQEIRERRGRAYSVYSFLSCYLDAGYAGIYVGTSPQWVREVVEVVRTELGRLTRDGLREEEITRVKQQMKGNMLLGLESSDSRMSRIARNEIYFGRDVSVAEVAAAIDAVTREDLLRVARRIFRPGTLALALLGDLKGQAIGGEVLAD